MKALVVEEFKDYAKHKVVETDAPELTKGHVRIEVHAAGVNFPDILLVEGRYQMKPPFPFIPGSEAAGIITEVANGGG